MKNRFLLSWILANAIGMSVGFLAFIQFLQFYGFGLNFKLHWDFEASQDLDLSTGVVVLGLSMGLPLFGAIFSAAQAIILKRFLPQIWYWILNGALGFLMVVIVIWPFAKIWGHIEGPVEPFTIVLGGTLFTIILQWRYLTKRGVKPTLFFVMFTVGSILGIAVLALLSQVMAIMPWAGQIAIVGLVVGGSAGLLSAKQLRLILQARPLSTIQTEN